MLGGLCLAAACRQAGDSRQPVSQSAAPDQTIEQFTIDAYLKREKAWSMSAPHADMYEADQQALVQKPSVIFFGKGAESSRLEAERGRIDMRTKDIWAWGRVAITAENGARLDSDWLQYKSAEDRIISSAPVTITKGDSITRGVGWEASPDLDEVVIHQQRLEIEEKDVPRKAKKK